MLLDEISIFFYLRSAVEMNKKIDKLELSIKEVVEINQQKVKEEVTCRDVHLEFDRARARTFHKGL